MATVMTINDNPEALLAAMDAAVTKGYFDSITAHKDGNGNTNGISCLDAEEHAVLSIYRNSTHGGYQWFCIFRLNSGTTVQDNFGGYHGTQNYAAQLTKIYICSGGIYLAFKKNGSGNGDIGGIIISKTNRGNTGILMLGVPYINSPSVSYRASIRAIAADDENSEAAAPFVFSASGLRNQTLMTCVPTCAASETISYFPDVRYLLTAQFNYVDNNTTPPASFTHQDRRFLWVGYFAVRDEVSA